MKMLSMRTSGPIEQQEPPFLTPSCTPLVLPREHSKGGERMETWERPGEEGGLGMRSTDV